MVSDILDKAKTKRYSIRITKVGFDSTSDERNGQLHLYIKKGEDSLQLAYGDVVRVLARPSEIPPPTNPEEFNYSAYVGRQHIHGQCFVRSDRVEVLTSDPDSEIIHQAFKVRNHLKEKLETYLPDIATRQIALALLIGVKDFLSVDLKTAYASSGAMHVLAVSGLHVGILYMLLLGLLRPLEKRKGGKYIIAFIAILVIWAYTFVTGMSPSVLRAATMFSVFALSYAFARENNIYNSLGISAFILLLYNPNLLFEVGFQLSFLAVTGIVYLQPKIYHLIYVKSKALDNVWAITAVSIAAQISTLPLTIYYFHQFPTYFFISNLVVIPGAMIIMVTGIGMLILGSFADAIGELIGWLLHWVIYAMNGLVQLIEQIPGSLITWLYFDGFEVTMVYGVMVLIALGFYQKSSFYLNASLIGLATIFGWNHVREQQRLDKNEIIIYDIADVVAADAIFNGQATLHVSAMSTVNEELLRFQIDPFRRASGLTSFSENLKEFLPIVKTKSALKFSSILNQKILVLDSTLNELVIDNPIETDILIINNQAARNVDWLLANFKFQQLIVGSDNPLYYTDWLQRELLKHEIKSHSLLRDGSWRMEL